LHELARKAYLADPGKMGKPPGGGPVVVC